MNGRTSLMASFISRDFIATLGICTIFGWTYSYEIWNRYESNIPIATFYPVLPTRTREQSRWQTKLFFILFLNKEALLICYKSWNLVSNLVDPSKLILRYSFLSISGYITANVIILWKWYTHTCNSLPPNIGLGLIANIWQSILRFTRHVGRSTE